MSWWVEDDNIIIYFILLRQIKDRKARLLFSVLAFFREIEKKVQNKEKKNTQINGCVRGEASLFLLDR